MSKENSHLRSILETVGVVVGSFIFAMVVIVTVTTGNSPEATLVVENKIVEEKATEADVKPVAEVKVAEVAAGETAGSESISGEQITQKNCALCHAGGLMNSPKIGDKDQWAPRIAQGKEMLVNNAINGIRTMPAKGGNPSLSDAEVAAAVVWMANSSGGNL
ncbi:MAG: cytochrome c5 family protein [Nitrosomonadales bacterium]|jgi:cytochrome c5|nr:cytochrome c5 family protein [Nitrosomonadales bacterium]MBT6015196.1 cytochrome c5 family protein [Nitrosomonadales bacterium]MBT7482380.1 cytochrome c5 family protein [Nitrosomonadales bacterium]MBT7689786.1 cytochrome c5 family protein [Nitrosomonadales bacterium]